MFAEYWKGKILKHIIIPESRKETIKYWFINYKKQKPSQKFHPKNAWKKKYLHQLLMEHYFDPF